jgi:ABC-type uncharacterized transport system fused permease/ATPase subunit
MICLAFYTQEANSGSGPCFGVCVQLIKPYWVDNPERRKPLLALGGVCVFALMATGVSVVFNFLGRDFYNALSAKQESEFYVQLGKYLAGFAVGIPVFVFRDYFTVRPILLCQH